MNQLDITEWMKGKCIHAHKYEERHGDQIVDAVKMSWSIEIPAAKLGEWFGKRLLSGFYMEPSAMLEGVEAPWVERRSDLMEGPHKIKGEYPGYIIHVRRGMGASPELEAELGQSDVSDFKADPKQGGTVVLGFKTRHVGLDQATIGKLCVMASRDVELKAMPPRVQDGSLPDGHKSAPKPHKSKPVSPRQMTIAQAEKAGTKDAASVEQAKVPDGPGDEPGPVTEAFLNSGGEQPAEKSSRVGRAISAHAKRTERKGGKAN